MYSFVIIVNKASPGHFILYQLRLAPQLYQEHGCPDIRCTGPGQGSLHYSQVGYELKKKPSAPSLCTRKFMYEKVLRVYVRRYRHRGELF